MDKYTVKRTDGSIDIDASVTNYRVALEANVVARNERWASIESAVEAVFDEHVGSRVPKTMLIDAVLTKLNVNVENHGSFTSIIEDYLRANTSKNNGDDGRRIIATKGQKGGLSRLTKP